MANINNSVRLRVWGNYACFTRPEMKVERVSYDVMTPSAARNILQSVLWKPAFNWQINRIDVIKPVRWLSIRRNEVGAVVPAGIVKTAMKSGSGRIALYIEEERQQRAGLILRDVEYVIHADLLLTPKAGTEENVKKFIEMFNRRAQKGQCFMQPYLGCREFVAFFEPLTPEQQDLLAIEDTKDLGWMLHDLDFTKEQIEPTFFRAQLKSGQLLVPPRIAGDIHR